MDSAVKIVTNIRCRRSWVRISAGAVNFLLPITFLYNMKKHCTPPNVHQGYYHLSNVEFLIYRFINIRQLQAAALEIKDVARHRSLRDVSSSKCCSDVSK